MANTKITVVGDGAEEPLTPEEEHRIEIKIDEMLDPSLPDKAPEAPVPAAIPEPGKAVPTPPAPVIPEVAEAPKIAKPSVRKIVPTFADEPEEEPVMKAEASKETATPAPSVAAPIAIKKTITIKHFDELEPADLAEPAESTEPETPKPVAKSRKAKSTTKKSAKKKAVKAKKAADDDLASKADAIAASALIAEEMIGSKKAKEEPVVEPAPQVSAEAPAPEVPDILPETTEDADGGAPPMIQKHAAPIIGQDDPEEPATSVPVPVQKKIAIVQDDPTDELITETTDEPQTEPAKPLHKTDIAINEIPDAAEEIPVEVESNVNPAPAKVEADASESKKYRPPDGPLQFKRAEVPIQPQKPGEPRVESAAPSEISEDEALAKAFETPKTTRNSDVARGLAGATVKLLKWTIILVVVAALVAVAAMPSLRTKALNLIGINKAMPATTAKTVPNPVTPAATATSPHTYISKRDGIYNLYKIVPGGQEQLLLAGTGKESEDLVLAPNAANTQSALVSTRDGKEDSNGTTQQSLTLVNTANGAATTIDSADNVKLIDWFDDRIVYVRFNTTTSTSDSNRYQLVSYDSAKKVRTVIDHTNYLNDVLSAKGSVYYATAASSTASGQFIKIQPDGTAKRTILSAEVAAITRTSFNSLTLATATKWYSYELDALQAAPTNNTSQGASRLYVTSPDSKHSAYLGESSGVLKLIITDMKTNKDTVLNAANVSYPIHWLSNDTIAYRSNNSDYSIPIQGGQGTKIADVFDAAGISLWYDQ